VRASSAGVNRIASPVSMGNADRRYRSSSPRRSPASRVFHCASASASLRAAESPLMKSETSAVIMVKPIASARRTHSSVLR
jgi:hypothetical protein